MSLSNPAKLLHGYMVATGVWDTAMLAQTFDIPVRTIQRLKLEIATQGEAVPATANSANCARYGATDAANCAISGASDAKPLARAYMESPSEIDSNQEVKITPLAPQGGRTTGRKRGSRLDPDWELPADWRMWARTNFPAVTDEQVSDQAAQFRDFWIAKPGAQACKLDWEATWRNWCRRGLVIGSIRKPQYTAAYQTQGPEAFSDCYQ